LIGSFSSPRICVVPDESVVLGQVDARSAEQHVDHEHEGNEQNDQDDQCAASESLAM